MLENINLYGKNYKLVWEDHFDGDSLNEKFWEISKYYDITRDGRKAWRKPENISTENSNLVIRARVEENSDYTSGMIKTVNRFMYKYGYAEIRAKLPKGGPGIWPGFWMCGICEYLGKAYPEVDVFEMFGDDRKIAANMHSWWNDADSKVRRHINYMDGKGYPKSIALPNAAKFSDDYHTIGYEWTPELVQFLVDGEPYTTVMISGDQWKVFHEPMYFILSMAYGLPFLPAPVWEGEDAEYSIDYIRLYQNGDGKLYKFTEDGIKEINSVD